MNDDQRTVDDEHAQLRTFAGPHALGQLDADERARFEQHLHTCAICRQEVDELALAAAALRAMSVPGEEAVPGAEQPRWAARAPADLADRVVGAVAREQRQHDRRRWLRTASVAAVAAAVAAAVLVTGLVLTREEPPPVAVVPMEPVVVIVEESDLNATANLVNHTWGVEIRLEATGFERGARYQAFLVADDGTAYPAGEFVGVGEVVMRCNLNSALLRGEADGFEIRDASGQVVARSDFGPDPTT